MTDGWDDADGADDRVIQGTLIKCVDGHWTDRDKHAIPAGTRLLALSTHQLLQRWQDDQPVETIPKKPGEPLPDVDELNARIPRDQWESSASTASRGRHGSISTQFICSTVTSAERFTFINSTVGARIAVENLKDQVKWMRAMRGADVFPVVELSSAPMKTKMGTKIRPDFRVVGWRQLGDGEPGPVTGAPPTTPAIGKPVAPVSNREALDDEIPI